LNDKINLQHGKATIHQSVDFLINYASDLNLLTPSIQNKMGKVAIQQEVPGVSPPSCQSLTPVSLNKCFWENPTAGKAKVNVDASFIPANGQASVGILARNDKGEIIFSAARMLVGCKSAEEAELQAISEGQALSSIWVKEPVICETDCAVAVKAINKPGKDFSTYCSLINDIKETVSSGNVSHVTSVKRECNRVAHSLATYARICNSAGFWLGGVPAFSEPLFVEDCKRYDLK
jgi:ribonuclease HI